MRGLHLDACIDEVVKVTREDTRGEGYAAQRASRQYRLVVPATCQLGHEVLDQTPPKILRNHLHQLQRGISACNGEDRVDTDAAGWKAGRVDVGACMTK